MHKNLKLPKDWRPHWDFSECPKEELSFCASYEYLRQVAMIHRKRLMAKPGIKWTPDLFAEAFKGYFKDGKRTEFSGCSDDVNDPAVYNLAVKQQFALAVSKCSDFPDRPYLSLQSEERKAWIKEFSFDQLRPDRPTMAQTNLFEIHLEPSKALPYYQYHLMAWERQNLATNLGANDKSSRKIVSFDGFDMEVGMIRINWSLQNKRLLEAFREWLGKNRPKDSKMFETRGAAQLSESLKYLSAMRVLNAMTAPEAYIYTEKLLGKPIYWTDDNWYEARNKARKVMAQISSPFFTWA